MNKKLLAVALATAFAAPAMADGAVDLGYLVRGDSINGVGVGKGTQAGLSSGMNGHNGIGFKGSEALGNGMTVSFDTFFQFNMDSGDAGAVGTGSTFRTLYSTLALTGDFGTVVAGRTGGARAAWLKKYDPFGGFGVASPFQAHGGGQDYANNVVAWVTPEIMPGLKGLFAYTSNLLANDAPSGDNGNLYAVAAMYDSGPLSFVANYERLISYARPSNDITATLTNGQTIQVVTFGASYDFGVAKLFGAYDQLTNLTNGWQVGLSAPVSEATTLKVAYGHGESRGAAPQAECSKWGIGATHSLSKRTSLYADYGRLSDSDVGSACARGINTYNGSHGNITGSDGHGAAAFGKWGTNVGVRHTF
ncbi:MAG: porin [Betaproteobacteria bacterium]|nr:porin [Betaproteobacteria bacterium]